MKENFPNLVKEIDMQVQEAQSPKQDGCKEAHTKPHYNQNTKDKENLKSSKRKAFSHLQGSSHKIVSWFLKRNFTDQKTLARNIESDEKLGPTTKITPPSKAII